MDTSAVGRSDLDSATLYAFTCHGATAEQETALRALWRYLFPVVVQLFRGDSDPEDRAADIVQQALERIYFRAHECRAPGAFRTWCRRIAVNLALDELRRRKRLDPAGDAGLETVALPPVDEAALVHVSEDELRALLVQAPISPRSYRVVVGRFLDEREDEELAAAESRLSDDAVRPSHIQVTRSKNLAKLRTWDGWGSGAG